jgi:hypothetical protein
VVFALFAEKTGRVSGLIGVSSGSGALLALFVFLRAPVLWDDPIAGLRYTYVLVASLSFAFSLFLYFALRIRPVIELPRSCSASSTSSDEENEVILGKVNRILPILTDGLLAIKNPRILLGYMAGEILSSYIQDSWPVEIL